MLEFYLLYVYRDEEEPLFLKIYHKYNQKLLNLSYSILKNQADAEDATQESWIAIAQNIHKLKDLDNEKIEIYIYKVVKSRSINLYNRKKNQEICLELRTVENLPDILDIETEYTTRELSETILSCLLKMKPYYREVLTLYYLYEMKPTQIAESLGRPLQTVKSQLYRGKSLLKEALGEQPHD